jgi:hypothetical protein
MTLLQFLVFHITASVLKVIWFFYNEEQKEGTLKMVEGEIFKTLLDNRYGEYDELVIEMQDLYLWLLEH